MPHRPFVKTLRAQWLGQQLRELREQRGMTLKLVSEHLGRDLSALGRYERAEWPIPRGDVVALLDLYGFHGARERASLLHVAEEVWCAHRWDNDPNDVVNTSFIDFPWLASRAEKICCYDAAMVPALFQTRDYATQIIQATEGPAANPDRIARLVDQHVERQEVLGEPSGARVAAIVDESALRRRIGDVSLMRAQLQHLDQVRRRPGVHSRVGGVDGCGYAAVAGVGSQGWPVRARVMASRVVRPWLRVVVR
jgi:transcriptional regulator with XRE-family HTH domain